MHFIIFDILHDPSVKRTISELLAEIDEKYLSGFESPMMFDESTVRKKLKEYCEAGIIVAEKEGRKAYYRRADSTDITNLDEVLHYFSEVAPCGVIGSICGLNGENDLYRNGAEIQNITSYVNLTAKAHGVGMIGGFVGYANHQSLIENCSWYGTFDAGIYRVDSGAGGFIGKIQENTSEVTIRNCAAYGTIKTNYEKNSFNDTPTIYMGGFLSFSNTGAKTTLENCLFAGKFERGENLTDQAFLGAFGTLRSVNSIKNCYYLGDDGLEAVHSDSNLKPESDNVEITSVTGAQLLSGEVAYKLGEHFGQILEGENRQSYPVLGGTKVEDSQRFEIYGQQLNIGADLSMKYYVMGYAPEFNSKGLYMEFSLGGVKTKVYADEPNADGFYVFVLEGINPQCMGDSIYAKLYYADRYRNFN